MSKLTLSKTIEAKKLNPKTGVGLPGTETTIPFGAIIDSPVRERDSVRFNYQMEPYGCRYQVLEEALDKASLAAVAAPASAATSARPTPAPDDSPRLQWEQVPSSGPATLRAKVPGGWLVSVSSGVAFVPDDSHAWDGTSA